MKIYVGDLRADERALVIGGLKRWAVHLSLELELTDIRKACDLALLDADHPQYVLAAAGERVISIGRAKIYGADAHVSRPVRGFQLASALSEILDGVSATYQPLGSMRSVAA
jgi:hypothetical protein